MNRVFLAFTSGLIVCGCSTFSSTVDSRQIVPRVSSTEIAALAAGSRVQIDCQQNHSTASIAGTVLQASPDGIALMNCISRARAVGTDEPLTGKILRATALFKISGIGETHIPVHWVSIENIVSTRVISPPPPGYVAPQLEIDTNDQVVFRRLGEPLAEDAQPGSASASRTVVSR